MKHLLFLLFSISLLLSGCSSKTTISSSENTSEISTENTITVYDDGTVYCSYDASLLQKTLLNPTDTLSYGIVFSDFDAEPSEAVINGNTVYAATMTNNSTDFINNYKKDSTKAIFDGVFSTSSDSTAEIIQLDDGNYEYTLNQNGLICKGKILATYNNTL